MAHVMKSRGVPDQLKGTVRPSGKVPAADDAIPPAFRSTIRQAESAGEESGQAGAEGLAPIAPPSNGQLARLGVRDAIVPPSSWHVP
jgi:hypothetical protein